MKNRIFTNNRGFMNHRSALRVGGCKITDQLFEGHTKRLNSIRPYASKLSKTDKDIVITEMRQNPWYILRELVRVQVGNTKRFITLSRPEFLALFNAINGGTTFVSAPHGTCNTTLLVLLTLMRLPKVVVYTTSGSLFKDPYFEEKFMEEYNKYVSLMPAYVQEFMAYSKPHLVPYMDIDSSTFGSKDLVPGFKPEECIFISENYELGNTPLGVKTVDYIQDKLSQMDNVPWLLTSPTSDIATSEFFKRYKKADPDTVGLGENLTVSVRLEDIPRFKSDRSKVRYYQNIISKYNLQQIFEPRS